MKARLSPRSLFWRVFIVNAVLVTVAVVVLAASPITVSNPTTRRQLVVLAVGLALLLSANFLLLRISLRPLERLTTLMHRIDLLRPGSRLDVSGAHELRGLQRAFNEMLERLETERRTASTRAVARDEAERRRVSRELHDQVGQGLTALLLQLRTALAQAPEPVRATLLEAQAIARENLDEVRRIARRLRPTMLDDLGLTSALRSLADAVDTDAGPEIVCRIDENLPAVPDDVELALYRIAQEALTNALRHAGATRIELTYRQARGEELVLAIQDDGRGMIYAPDVEFGGIRGMRERAVAAGAELVLTTRPGQGTMVSVAVRTDS